MDNLQSFQPHNPLIVQSDHTLLLEVHNPLYEPARTAIGAFAELEKTLSTSILTALRRWRCGMPRLLAKTSVARLANYSVYIDTAAREMRNGSPSRRSHSAW